MNASRTPLLRCWDGSGLADVAPIDEQIAIYGRSRGWYTAPTLTLDTTHDRVYISGGTALLDGYLLTFGVDPITQNPVYYWQFSAEAAGTYQLQLKNDGELVLYPVASKVAAYLDVTTVDFDSGATPHLSSLGSAPAEAITTDPAPTGNNTSENLIINPGFSVDQRGGGASRAAGDDTYCFDRWIALSNAGTGPLVERIVSGLNTSSYAGRMTLGALDRLFPLFMVSADGRRYAENGYENTAMSRTKESAPPKNTAYYAALACTTSNEADLERAMQNVNAKLADPQFSRDLASIKAGFDYWTQQHNRTTYR